MKKEVLAAAIIAVSSPALSETIPQPMQVDSRSTTAIYQDGQVYRIYTQLRRVTLVELAPGERFLDFKAGDTESFMFTDTSQDDAIMLKPVIAGAVTNGVIVTNRRNYLVELHETSSRQPHYQVSFTDPAGSSRNGPKSGIAPGTPKTYSIAAVTSEAEISPVRVWDDGQRTYFQFDPDAPTPSIYRADARGREYLVNTRTDGTVTTVGRRADRWVIRYGDQYACIQSGDV